MTVTLTTGANRCAFAFSCTHGNDTTNASNVFNIAVDGTLVYGTSGVVSQEIVSGAAGDQVECSLVGLTDVLTAGSHTVKVQWKVNSASSGTVYATAANIPRLSVWEVK
jgi:hypothetical protein